MNVKLPLVIGSVLLTACCWGIYGPLLHVGQESLGGNRLRAFLCVGLAYFLIAVVVPLLMMSSSGKKPTWTFKGLAWSLAAGSVGALGALGIILAFNYGGLPVYVMPLVFGCAPVVNSFWTIYWQKTWKDINAFFAAGLILVAVGAVTVLFFAPTKPPAPKVASAADSSKSQATDTAEAAGSSKTDSSKGSPAKPTTDKSSSEKKESANDSTSQATTTAAASPTAPRRTDLNWPLVIGSVAMTACCWGIYGPLLHWGQMGLGGNRLQAFLCVGLAYFGIAVIAPAVLLGGAVVEGWTFGGILWSLLAGSVGAVGALGIILAFNYGGKPVYVMPLVFGCAPVVNAFWTMSKQGTWGQVNAFFAAGLILAAVGAMTVLFFAPVSHGPAKPGEKGPAKSPEPKSPEPKSPEPKSHKSEDEKKSQDDSPEHNKQSAGEAEKKRP